MATKRRKVSHEDGAIEEASVSVPKTKSKHQPAMAPKSNDPVPSSGSDAESATVDDASRQKNGDAAPKSFRDLVCDTFAVYIGVATNHWLGNR
jgi:ATP-dependent RNA helicase DDX47/RRP3